MTQRLEQILKKQELTHLTEVFSTEGITDSVLGELSDADLQSIGITQLGVRKRLLKEFAEYASPSASDKIVPTDVSKPSDVVDMIPVAGGVLPATSPFPDAKVASFLIARTQVTVAQWRTTRRWAQKNEYGFEIGDGPGSEYPITCVTWLDAIMWCNARSEMEGLQPVYYIGDIVFRRDEDIGSLNRNPLANGYRLPLDKEWFWAASGAEKGVGYRFSGSNNCDAVGWFHEESSHPVGEREPNELGLYDMSGNVWEWGELETLHKIEMPHFGGSFREQSVSVFDFHSQFIGQRIDNLGLRPVRNVEDAFSTHIRTGIEARHCFGEYQPLDFDQPIQMINIPSRTIPEYGKSESSDISISINAFTIAPSPLTLDQWRSIYGKAHSMGYDFSKGNALGPAYPVTEVSWYDIQKWCNARSEIEGLQPFYLKGKSVFRRSYAHITTYCVGNGYRIPTLPELQWTVKIAAVSICRTYVSGQSRSLFYYVDNRDQATSHAQIFMNDGSRDILLNYLPEKGDEQNSFLLARNLQQ